ncbi:MAG: hypothetical protein JSW73_01695 [Candidatus Woesearchaeota archaeon]|nr:MAG: hypothetical protein JSW73_01695 [Candidatus Woesearchaeota archaeon]
MDDNQMKKLTLSERFRVRLFRLDKDENKFEEFLLRDATETEKKVYYNMKKIDLKELENLAKSAIKRLDAENDLERIFGAGEVAKMKEHKCYIGNWIFGGYVWHRWLPDCKRLINPEQYKTYKEIEKNIFSHFDFGKKDTKIYISGQESMSNKLANLNINCYRLTN